MRPSSRSIAILVLAATATGCSRPQADAVAPPPVPAFVIPARPTPAAGTPAELQELADECFTAAEALVHERPRAVDGLLVLGDVHEQYGGTETAIALWNRCLEIDPAFALPLCRVAAAAATRGDDATAIDRYRAALALDRDLSDAGLPLAAALLRTGDAAAAADVGERVVAARPEAIEGWCLLGKARLQQDDPRAAADAFRRAVAIDAESREALQGLGTSLQRLGESDEARVHLEAVARLQSGREHGYDTAAAAAGDDRAPRERASAIRSRVARILAARGAAAAAEEGWRRAIELDPAAAESREALATALANRGQPAAALAVRVAWCEAEQTNPAAWFGFAQLALRMGETQKAEAALRVVMALAPNRPEGYALMAQLKKESDLDEAIMLAERLVELAPSPAHLVFLAELRGRAGDRDGARAAARRALDLDPGDRAAAAVLRAVGAGP